MCVCVYSNIYVRIYERYLNGVTKYMGDQPQIDIHHHQMKFPVPGMVKTELFAKEAS